MNLNLSINRIFSIRIPAEEGQRDSYSAALQMIAGIAVRSVLLGSKIPTLSDSYRPFLMILAK